MITKISSRGLIFIFFSTLALALPANAQVASFWTYRTDKPAGVHDSLWAARQAIKNNGPGTEDLRLKQTEIRDDLTIRYYQTDGNSEVVLPSATPWEYRQINYSPVVGYPDEASAVNDVIQLSSVGRNPCGYDAPVPATDWIWHVSGWETNPQPIGPLSADGIRGYSVTQRINYPTCDVESTETFVILSNRQLRCDDGYILNQTAGGCVGNETLLTATITSSNLNYSPKECVGNPCSPATGDKFLREVDYEGPHGLSLVRTYHSNHYYGDSTHRGRGWTHNYVAHIMMDNNGFGLPFALFRPDGSVEPLEKRGPSLWVSASGSGLQLHAEGNWVVYLPDGSQEIYSALGALLKLRDPAGLETTIKYWTKDSNTGKEKPVVGAVDKVIGPFGHTLQFSYYPSSAQTNWHSRLKSVTDPAGNTITYTNTSGDLTSVEYQDGTIRTYEDVIETFLTGIIDENGDRFATYEYDGLFRVITSKHAGGQGRVTLSYNADGTTTVTDAVGNETTYTFQNDTTGLRKANSVTLGGGTRTSLYESTSPRRLLEKVDERGIKTEFSYDQHHLTRRVEAAGSPEERETTFEYLDEKHSLPTRVTTPSVRAGQLREVLVAYDVDEQPTAITISGYRPDGTQIESTTTLGYNEHSQINQIDGPLPGTSDTTTFVYRNCKSGIQCGQLQSITNALGKRVLTVTGYDAHGRFLTVVEPRGLTTDFTYDLRGRVLSVTQTPDSGVARVTTLAYDNVGQLKTLTQSDGLVLTYSYDAAHNLTSITDNFDNRVEYEYDLKGNRTDEHTYDQSGVLRRTLTTTYDIRNRIDQINAAGSITDLVFDAVGNLASVTDPQGTTTHNYDAFNRVFETIDALNGKTTFDYDVNDNLTQVKAPNGAMTDYVYDDLGNLLQEVSPDRGTINHAYDTAGNRISTTDARGLTTLYEYDVLNRLTSATYDDGQTVRFTYDIGATGRGNLGRITDSTGSTEWDYNNFGDVIEKRQIVGAITLTTSYTYNAAGQLATMTYPSGAVVSYSYNSHRLSGLGINGQPLLSNATYEPFGPVNGWTWNNGTVHSREYDLKGQLTSQTLGGDTRTLTYDLAGSITSLLDSRTDLTLDYDALGRLTDSTAGNPSPSIPASQEFDYDANGNRLTYTESGAPYPYSYVPNSNRLTRVAGPQAKSYAYDAAGNVTADGLHSYTYDATNRLVVVDGGSATYELNGLGQRVAKDAGARTLFAYDELGQLMGEYDNSGNPLLETIYFDLTPVGVVQSAQVYQVHADHLNTPREVTDGQTVLWRWHSDPFGTTLADEDVDDNGTPLSYNLRFPGQYYDQETGLYYNYFRDYDPTIGRYVQSDPIGLGGGLGLYGYAYSNPVTWTDRLGLRPPRFPIGEDAFVDRLRIWRYIYSEIEPDVAAIEQAFSFPTPPKPTPTELADFFNDLSRQAGAASGLCFLAGQPQGVLGFGAVALIAITAEQLIRPDINAVVRDAYIDVVTDRLPPHLGVPTNVIVKEVIRQRELGER